MAIKESKYTPLRPVGRCRLRVTSARIFGLHLGIIRGRLTLADLSRANCRFPCNQRQQLVVEMKLAAQKPQSFGHNTQGEERRQNTTIHALAHPQHEHVAEIA